MTELSPRQQTMVRLGRDRPLAHRVLFSRRHANADPPFKRAMIDRFHSSTQYICELAFRGSAKSTTAEEAVAIGALFQEFRFCIFFGANADLAAERVHNIRREFERNERLISIFGQMRGPVWGDDRIELSNGVVIKAMGRGEALRGTKGEIERPDLIIFDDIEDVRSLATEKGRDKIQSWVFGDAIPSMADPLTRRVRILANALHEEALAMKLKNPKSGFETHVTPIEHLDEEGERISSWPARYPLEAIDAERERLYSVGRGREFEAEYMCNPTSPASRPFKSEMFFVEPRVRTWQAVCCMYDPARTVSAKAATTGFAAWSWENERLVIWDAWAKQLMPDEIINSMFQVNEEYHPVFIGFEEDGLNQWALQPIRMEMARRGVTIPLEPQKAPVGKLDFIRALQNFFVARLVTFAKPMPDLERQLLGFPTGPIDAPNALAFAMKLRTGAPVYDDFRGVRHVAEDIRPLEGRPLHVALNATRTSVTAAIVQVHDEAIRIYGDFVREGEPAQIVAGILQDVRLAFPGCQLRFVGGPLHFDQYNNVGLRQAMARLPVELQPGLGPERGRGLIRKLLREEIRGMPALMISPEARWTLNALAGGYARALLKQGVLADYAQSNAYRVLMEGLESFAGLLDLGSTSGAGEVRLNAQTPDGRAYRSMLGGAQVERPSKGDWGVLLKG